ncbi:MAG: hypothetical protein MPN21_24475 [Thermoanaerobaculia bacterium]|nr:hypothetical protein [Thermoanaerobaculia bacterium]
MEIRDYNGDGVWTATAILDRYAQYCKIFNVATPRCLDPDVHEKNGTRWIYPAMEKVIEGIEAEDLACTQIGIEFIQEDQGFTFGAILKSNTARALRRHKSLTLTQVSQIRSRIVKLLRTGIVPREYREYAKLLRAIGVGPHWPEIQRARPQNRYAQRAKAYFLAYCAP